MSDFLSALGGRFPDTGVLHEDLEDDWARRGLGPWTQLHDVAGGWQGSVQCQPLSHGGTPYLALVSKGNSAEPAVLSREKSASAINRLNLVGFDGGDCIVDYQAWWGYTTPSGTTYGPRAIQFGVDGAKQFTSGPNRFYGLARVARFSLEEGVWTHTNKIQVLGTDGQPIDILDFNGDPAIFNCGYNENKGNRFFFLMRYNATTGQYMGLIIGNQGYGCFDNGTNGVNPFGTNLAAQEAMMEMTTAPPSTLEPFSNGLNATFDSLGLVTGTRTESATYMFSSRFSLVA